MKARCLKLRAFLVYIRRTSYALRWLCVWSVTCSMETSEARQFQFFKYLLSDFRN